MNEFTEERPWGNFKQLCLNTKCTVKILNVEPNRKLSLQYHNNREEYWKVLNGYALITLGEDKILLDKYDEIMIPKKTNHRIETKKSKITILEISFGKFDENDIVRIEDDYNRVKE